MMQFLQKREAVVNYTYVEIVLSKIKELDWYYKNKCNWWNVWYFKAINIFNNWTNGLDISLLMEMQHLASGDEAKVSYIWIFL